eukprot:20046-Heterococcus_DN1.PRE.1
MPAIIITATADTDTTAAAAAAIAILATDDCSADALVWEVHLAKLELFPGIRLHRLQTPTPLPQPEIPEYMHHLDNIALQSEIQQIRVAPFRKPNDTPRETGNGEPGTGWAYSNVDMRSSNNSSSSCSGATTVVLRSSTHWNQYMSQQYDSA